LQGGYLHSDYPGVNSLSDLIAGVIGLGAMGGPIARHLASEGLLAGVWNRTTKKAEVLSAELGVTRKGSPSELAAECNVLLTCVSADEDLEAVLKLARPGLTPGDVVIDTSTVSPVLTRHLAEHLAQNSVGYVDAPVSGGVEGAVKGTLSVMAGGDFATYSRVLPVLEAFSSTVTHMGPVGSGQATKAVNQVIVGGMAEAVCEALALSEKLNLPSERLLPVLCGGAADSWFLRHRGQSMLDNRFETGFKLSLLLKDLKIIRALARELNIDMHTVNAAIGDYEALVTAGDGDNDISGLIKRKRMQMSADRNEQEGKSDKNG
jgi:3-hydroxyisobutyrate dehydrogenase